MTALNNQDSSGQDSALKMGDDELFIVNVSRRKFLRDLALTGFVLAAGFPCELWADETATGDKAKYGVDGMPHGWVDNPLVFVAISEDGKVHIVCHRSEMGQGVRTSLPMVVADELEADWSQVQVVQAPGDEVRYGNQDTDGSRSMRHFFMPMRRVGAAARKMLEQAAATAWRVPASEVRADLHQVIHLPSGKKLGLRPARRCRLEIARARPRQLEVEKCGRFSLYRKRQNRTLRRH